MWNLKTEKVSKIRSGLPAIRVSVFTNVGDRHQDKRKPGAIRYIFVSIRRIVTVKRIAHSPASMGIRQGVSQTIK